MNKTISIGGCAYGKFAHSREKRKSIGRKILCIWKQFCTGAGSNVQILKICTGCGKFAYGPSAHAQPTCHVHRGKKGMWMCKCAKTWNSAQQNSKSLFHRKILCVMEISSDFEAKASYEKCEGFLMKGMIFWIFETANHSFNLPHCIDNYPKGRKRAVILSARPWLVLG